MNYSHMTLPLSIRKEKRAYTKSSKEQLLVSIIDFGRWVKAKELIKVTKLSSAAVYCGANVLKKRGLIENDLRRGYLVTDAGKKEAMRFLAEHGDSLYPAEEPVVDPPTFQFGVHYPVTPPTPKQAEQPTALVEAKEEARFWKEEFVELSFKLAERS